MPHFGIKQALIDALYSCARVPKYHAHTQEPRLKISNNMVQKTDIINLWHTQQNFLIFIVEHNRHDQTQPCFITNLLRIARLC
jgi:hypothetical protein